MRKPRKLVFISGVDGCLLDRASHSHAEADAALDRARRANAPIVLCSSKTRAETERLREDLGVSGPFIVENGGALFVPDGAFPVVPAGAIRKGAYDVIELGRPHSQVLQTLLATAARAGVDITTFSDMSVQRVATECGLSLAEARLAKLREYDEPFRLVDPDPAARAKLRRSLRSAGLRCADGGAYDHVTLATDSGVAVALLRRICTRAWGDVTAVGLGSGPNDVEMLLAVDVPIVVRSSDERATSDLLARVRRVTATALEGPAGWSDAVIALLDGVGRDGSADGTGATAGRPREAGVIE